MATPFPGTGLFRRLKSEGRILSYDWNLYDGQHVVFRPAQMTVEQLHDGIRTAWKHAYSYRSILSRLSASPSSLPVYIGANLGYRFYAHNLHRYYNCDWIAGLSGKRSAA